MDVDWTAIAIALVAAIPGLIALWRKRKIDDVNFSERVTETAEKWFVQYEERIEELESKTSRQESVILSQQEEISQQRKLIVLQQEEIAQQKRMAASQQEQINLLTTKVNAQEEEIQSLWDGARALECQIVNLGEEPVWRVPRRKDE